MTKKEIEKVLKDHDLLVTENRVKIMNCLSDGGGHFHAISDIKKHVGAVNTKSIYNNIKTMIDKGIIDSYSFGGVSKYAINDNLHDTNTIHLVNTSGEVDHIEVDPKIFKKIAKEVASSGKTVKKIKIYVDIK